MKSKVCFLLVFILSVGSTAWSIPSTITYQGALKDNGVPANGTRVMTFRITNQSGTQVYWASGDMNVPVSNGLFSAQINPTGVDWENVTPFLDVSVNGQQLLPREPVSATVYAAVSASVANGSVTPSKVATGYGLVPSGMIAMFASSCPTGWTRFSALDGVFPLGGSTYGTAGGNATHAHSLAITQTISGGGANVIGTSRSSSNNELWQFGGAGGYTVDVRSANTNSQNHLPPYLTVVYCQKT